MFVCKHEAFEKKNTVKVFFHGVPIFMDFMVDPNHNIKNPRKYIIFRLGYTCRIRKCLGLFTYYQFGDSFISQMIQKKL